MWHLRPVLIMVLIFVLLSPYKAYADGSDDLVIGWITTQVGIQIQVAEGRRVKDELGVKGFFDNALISEAMEDVHIDYSRMRDSVEETYYSLTADVRANYLNLYVQYNGTGVQINNSILNGLQFGKFINNARSYGCVTVGGGSSEGGGASRVFGGGGGPHDPLPTIPPSEEPTPEPSAPSEPAADLDYKFESRTIYRDDLYDYFLSRDFGNSELDAVYYASAGQSSVLSAINTLSNVYLYEIIIDGDTLEKVYDIGTRYHLSTKYFYGFDSNNFTVQILARDIPVLFDLSPTFRNVVLPKGYYSLAYGGGFNYASRDYFTFRQDSDGVVNGFISWTNIDSYEETYSYNKGGQTYHIPASGANWDYYFGAANKSVHIKEYVIVDEPIVPIPTPEPEPDYIINQNEYEKNITNNNYYNEYNVYNNDEYSTFFNAGDVNEDYVINNVVNNNYYVDNTTIINNIEDIDGYVPVDDPDEPPTEIEIDGIDFSPLVLSAEKMKTKFPFSIPFDIITLYKTYFVLEPTGEASAEKLLPVYEVNFDKTLFPSSEDNVLTVDFNMFNSPELKIGIKGARAIFFVMFVILFLKARSVFK